MLNQNLLASANAAAIARDLSPTAARPLRPNEASARARAGAAHPNYLPGLRPLELEVDAYFAEAFRLHLT